MPRWGPAGLARTAASASLKCRGWARCTSGPASSEKSSPHYSLLLKWLLWGGGGWEQKKKNGLVSRVSWQRTLEAGHDAALPKKKSRCVTGVHTSGRCRTLDLGSRPHGARGTANRKWMALLMWGHMLSVAREKACSYARGCPPLFLSLSSLWKLSL